MTRDVEFRWFLEASDVNWAELDSASSIDAENEWRRIFGNAFVDRTRARHGSKAENAYRMESCNRYLVVPFTSDVRGLPVRVVGRTLAAYECRGPLVDFLDFNTVELFVSPTDFSWTMVYTHEDHAFGGPHFHKREWLAYDPHEPGVDASGRSRRS